MELSNTEPRKLTVTELPTMPLDLSHNQAEHAGHLRDVDPVLSAD